MLSQILPPATFTSTELHEIAIHLSNPSVRKYLIEQARICYESIGEGLPMPNESAESYLRRQASVVGSLGALQALLSIEASQPLSS